MPDIDTLHQAVVTTSEAVAQAGGSASSWHGLMVGGWILAMIACATAALVLRPRKAALNPQPTPLIASVALGLASVACLGFGLSTAMRPARASQNLILAQTKACDALLGQIRHGQVSWMRPEWQADVEESCGTDRFQAAIHAPQSLYDTHQH